MERYWTPRFIRYHIITNLNNINTIGKYVDSKDNHKKDTIR